MRTITLAVFLVLAVAGQLSLAADIDITRGQERPQILASPDFVGNTDKARDFVQIIRSDLERGGLKLALADDFPRLEPGQDQVDYSLWRQFGTDNLLIGSVYLDTDGRSYKIRYSLLGIGSETQLLDEGVAANDSNLRRVAHQAANRIFEKLFGQPGAFNTLLAYVETSVLVAPDEEVSEEVSEAGKVGGRRSHYYRIFVSEYDGSFPTEIYSSYALIQDIAWSPDSKLIAYVSASDTNPVPRVHIQTLATGDVRIIPGLGGASSGPAFSPDGTKLAVSMADIGGSSDIYVIDLKSENKTKITKNSAIDASPAWSPDGTKLIFTSNRTGNLQLFEMNATGGKLRRLTFKVNYAADGVYMPRGDNIALVYADAKGYKLGLLNIESFNLQPLTGSRLRPESPTVAPNGTTLLYADILGNGRHVISGLAATGGVSFTIGGKNKQLHSPAWSPFLR